MKSEINDYKINNADGTSKSTYSEQKISFDNDNPRYIKENPVSAQKENVFVSETFDEPKKGAVKDNKDTPKTNDNLSSVSSASSASTAASTSSAASAASAASAIGGSVGAIAGTVAASVVSAVIVVAAFVSTLVINLSLAMAGMHSLVFAIEMTGAQEEDFVNPIVAVLEGENDVYREQEIHPDTLFITFDDLEPSTEYVITVKNEEKVFFKKSYFTASEEVEKGFISAYYEGDEVFVSVKDVSLKSGEFYTVTAKDDKGKVVFAKDDIEPNKEFSFKLSDFKDLSFTLSVNGKVYSLTQIHVQAEPEYDFNNPVWNWKDDFSATVSFTEIHGGEPLVLIATVTDTTIEPTCKADGRVDYTATAIYGGQTFSDERSVTLSALGHEYGEPQFAWEQGENGYSAVAIFVCGRDSGHVMTLPATVNQEGDTFYLEVEYDKETYYGELPTEYDYDNPVWEWEKDGTGALTGYATVSFDEIHRGEPLTVAAETTRSEIEPTCETDGQYVYLATITYNDKQYSDTKTVVRENTATGHEYGEPVFEWSEDGEYGYTAKAIFTCSRDDTHTFELPADVVQGNYEFTAYVEYNGQMYENTLYLENPDEPMPSNGVELSLNDGFIGIDPTGYARSHNDSTLIGATSYVSSESGPYIISGTIYADDSLDIYNMTGTKKTIYLRFNEVYIQAGMWATAFRIIANADLDIYIVNEGSTTINAGNHYGIEVQGDITVNIYVTGSESFNLSGDNGPFGVSRDRSGTCNLYINGVKQ